LVLPQYTEDENSANSGTYNHIEWRSIAEVIQYLGAVLRAGDRSATWTESSEGGLQTHPLSLLNELVSSDIPNTQPIQVIP
jgi:hypothetical protein